MYAAIARRRIVRAGVVGSKDCAKASGRATVEQMKATPTDDPNFGKGSVRPDGRMIHDMHRPEVKSLDLCDYYTLKHTIPAATLSVRSARMFAQ